MDGKMSKPGNPNTVHVKYRKIHTSDLKYDEKFLERGTYGDVRKATWLSKSVAVKMFSCAERKGGFSEELVCLSMLHEHANIVNLHGAHLGNTQTDRPFLVLEFAPYSLEKVLHQCRRELKYTVDHVMSWTVQMAIALEYIHSQNMLHRDIKPSNILLFQDGCVLKLCDFGTARKLEHTLTNAVGTSWYMAPEVIRGTCYTASCDVYSFGVVLWELLTRHKPYLSGTHGKSLAPQSVLYRVATGGRPPMIATLPKCLEELIRRCWDEGSHKRPTTLEIKSKMERLVKLVKVEMGKPFIRRRIQKVDEITEKGAGTVGVASASKVNGRLAGEDVKPTNKDSDSHSPSPPLQSSPVPMPQPRPSSHTPLPLSSSPPRPLSHTPPPLPLSSTPSRPSSHTPPPLPLSSTPLLTSSHTPPPLSSTPLLTSSPCSTTPSSHVSDDNNEDDKLLSKSCIPPSQSTPSHSTLVSSSSAVPSSSHRPNPRPDSILTSSPKAPYSQPSHSHHQLTPTTTTTSTGQQYSGALTRSERNHLYKQQSSPEAPHRQIPPNTPSSDYLSQSFPHGNLSPFLDKRQVTPSNQSSRNLSMHFNNSSLYSPPSVSTPVAHQDSDISAVIEREGEEEDVVSQKQRQQWFQQVEEKSRSGDWDTDDGPLSHYVKALPGTSPFSIPGLEDEWQPVIPDASNPDSMYYYNQYKEAAHPLLQTSNEIAHLTEICAQLDQEMSRDESIIDKNESSQHQFQTLLNQKDAMVNDLQRVKDKLKQTNY